VSSRTLRWEGCCNVRDLGGLRTENGSETQFGVVVRADNIRGLSDEGWRALSDYGVERIVDLRYAGERDEDPPRDVAAEVVHAPLVEDPATFDELDELLAGITDPTEWRRENYCWLLDRFPGNFARAVSSVAGAPEGTVLVHCAGGVDRTGLVSALLLRLAGVPVAAVGAVYAASEANCAPFSGDWIDGSMDLVEREKRELLSVMPAAAMVDSVSWLEEEHGDVRSYLLAAGVAEADVERVRARLLG
jgi:hypothetical protein